MGKEITTENVRAALVEAEQEASRLFAEAEQVKAAIVESGINPLGASTDEQDAFEKVDTAYKAYDLKKEEAAQLQAKLDRLTEIDGVGTPGAGAQRRPLQGAPAREALSRRIGDRFMQSESYQRLVASGALGSDANLQQAIAGGVMPVDVLSRDEFESLMGNARFGATTVTGASSTSAGPFIQNDLVPGFVAYNRKRPLLSALVGQGTTDSDTVEYVSQSAGTQAAAETAEDTAAAESTYAFATNTVAVQEITHFVPVTNRAMSDHGQLRTIIENELMIGALDRLDTQLASGDGISPNIEGIYTATTQTQALGGLTRSEAIHKGITAIRVAAGVLSEPDNIGLHPADFEDLILEQDANLQYIFGPPSQAESRTAWGIPLVTSTVFTSGTPLVGDFAGSARLWLREGLAVSAGLDGNDFTKRRISLLAALRVAFKVVRPGGFCEITGF